MPREFARNSRISIGHYSNTNLKSISRRNSLTHSLFYSLPIAPRICTGHGSVIAVLCERFDDDCTTKMDITGEHDFATFEFKMSYRGISCITPTMWFRSNLPSHYESSSPGTGQKLVVHFLDETRLWVVRHFNAICHFIQSYMKKVFIPVGVDVLYMWALW